MQCLILAGGLGTRLRPITEKIPKAMVEVAGLPFAHYQLSWLRAQGIDRVVYSIGYLGQMLRDYVGDGRRWGIDVRYADEGETLKGTAGAVRVALDQGMLDPAFFVLYGDSFLPIEYAPVWQASHEGTRVLMTVFHNQGRWDASNVRYRDGMVELYQKGHPNPASAGLTFVDYGLSVMLRSEIEERVPPGMVADLAATYHDLSVAGRLAGYEVSERFYEVGSIQGIQDLEAALAATARFTLPNSNSPRAPARKLEP